MRFFIAIALVLAACGDDITPTDAPDGGATCFSRAGGPCLGAPDAAPAATPDAQLPPADAETLGDCAATCPDDQIVPWVVNGAAEYEICLPSYAHCAPAPTCADACDITAGASIFCEHAGNVCTCAPTTGEPFTCVGPA